LFLGITKSKIYREAQAQPMHFSGTLRQNEDEAFRVLRAENRIPDSPDL